MKDCVEDRAVELGEYIVENKATVRAAAKVFGISKSQAFGKNQSGPLQRSARGARCQQSPAPHPRRTCHARKI